MEISDVRKRILQTIDRAKQRIVERRARTDEATRTFGPFLNNIAVPLARQMAQILRAEKVGEFAVVGYFEFSPA